MTSCLLSGTIVRKTGDGIIDGTWTDKLYYLGQVICK